MKYKFKVSQTIHKIIEIETDTMIEAEKKIQLMLERGEIHFDDEPWLDMDNQICKVD